MAGGPEGGRPVTAVYLVAQSPRADDEWARALRAAVDEVFDHFALNPAHGEDLHIAVTQIADTLYVNRALSPVAEPPMLSAAIVPLPGLEPDAALALLNRMIADDSRRLRSAGCAPVRPLVVLVLSDALLAGDLLAGDDPADRESDGPDRTGGSGGPQGSDGGRDPAEPAPRLVVVHADVSRVIPALVIAHTRGTVSALR